MIKGLAVAEATGQQRLGTLVGGGGGSGWVANSGDWGVEVQLISFG